MAEDTVQHLYDLIGADGITRLTAAFYQRVQGDDLLRPLYPDADLTGAERRLRDFLIFRCGGPPEYIMQRGHPRLRLRHAPFPVDQRARDRWVALMEQALDEVAFAAPVHAALQEFFRDVATFLINRPA